MHITPVYNWNETYDTISISVFLRSTSKDRGDLDITSCMVKLNAAPYFLLLDLHKDVEPDGSTATWSAQRLDLQLRKTEAGIWGALLATGSKAEITARRNASMEAAQQRLEAAHKAKLERKHADERDATERQMAADRARRELIEQRKAAELARERAGLGAWQQQVTAAQQQEQQQQREQDGGESDYEDDEEHAAPVFDQQALAVAAPQQSRVHDDFNYHGRGWRRSPAGNASSDTRGDCDRAAKSCHIVELGSDEEDENDSSCHAKQTQLATSGSTRQVGRASAGNAVDTAPQMDTWDDTYQLPADDWPTAASTHDHEQPGLEGAALTLAVPVALDLPPPRASRLQPVPVAFTKLETGHLPAREQREDEIRAYKRNEGAAGATGDSRDVAERQPIFLKDKGDALFKQGNYRGAINAYTRALDFDPDMRQVWANRAACHLKLSQHADCAADCGRALELLRPLLDRYERGDLGCEDAVAAKKLLVKVLARRAAALAADGRDAEAVADLEEGLRLDPQNAKLQADLDELRACMAPADLAAIKARGLARYQAGDAEGAAQAFSLLLTLLPEQPPARPSEAEARLEQQLEPLGEAGAAAATAVQDRVAALSNRAACYLVLEQYGRAVDDCGAALRSLMACCGGGCSSGAAGSEPQSSESGAAQEDSHCEHGGCAAHLRLSVEWVDRTADAGTSGLDTKQLQTMARLLARRGAALSYQKRYQPALEDHRAAAKLQSLIGAEDQAAALQPDIAHLEKLAAEGARCAATGASTCAASGAIVSVSTAVSGCTPTPPAAADRFCMVQGTSATAVW